MTRTRLVSSCSHFLSIDRGKCVRVRAQAHAHHTCTYTFTYKRTKNRVHSTNEALLCCQNEEELAEHKLEQNTRPFGALCSASTRKGVALMLIK